MEFDEVKDGEYKINKDNVGTGYKPSYVIISDKEGVVPDDPEVFYGSTEPARHCSAWQQVCPALLEICDILDEFAAGINTNAGACASGVSVSAATGAIRALANSSKMPLNRGK